MGDDAIKFSDGAAYERYMGVWSRLAGAAFLEWLAPETGRRWLDVGCGNGAFTEMLANCCAPASLDGIDPSEAQLEFARTLAALRTATFRKGDAMALPYPDHSFDASVMPLVIFFVPDPAKAVAEMVRVTAPGGRITAYSWDIPGGGFPYFLLQEEMRSMGLKVPMPPSPEASRMDILRALWAKAGVTGIETQALTVHRTYSDLEEFWSIVLGAPSMGPTLNALTPDQVDQLQSRLHAALPKDAEGRISLSARAHAIQGKVKG